MLKKGFTLLEILITIGLLAIVASLGLFVSMESYHNSSFHNERDLFISALQHARAQAVNNVCIGLSCTEGQPHGVHIVTTAGTVTHYIVFQGTTYNSVDPLNTVIDVGKNISQNLQVTGMTDVYFDQLSASTTPTTITLQNNLGESSVITIGNEGQISWTN